MDSKKEIKKDFLRMFAVIVVIAILNLIDLLVPMQHIAYMTSVLSSTSIVLFIAAASHFMRRVFFPTISVTDLIINSKDHPIGAALSFLGIAIVLSSLIVVNVMLLN